MSTAKQKKKANRQILRRRLYKMISVGVIDDPINRAYDVISLIALLLNIVVLFAGTFDRIPEAWDTSMNIIEMITVAFFAVDYALCLITAKCERPEKSEKQALVRYIFSLNGLINLLSFLPYYLPFVFPMGATVFRMFRVVRIFRLFRINAYYDAFNVILEVFKSKRQQLLSSVFIIFVLMIASSLCMYSIENAAQPDVFDNAFSGIWWAVSTLLTVGYGDIYPITTAGKAVAIVITFLGVMIVAIPTGIISAGFVEQYQRLKRIGDVAQEDVHFIKIELNRDDAWAGQLIRDLKLPQGMLIVVIQRGSETVIPRGDVKLRPGDRLIIGADALKDDRPVNLKELAITKDHPWNGEQIMDLDISRRTLVVMIRRGDETLIPKGATILHEGDVMLLFTKAKAGKQK